MARVISELAVHGSYAIVERHKYGVNARLEIGIITLQNDYRPAARAEGPQVPSGREEKGGDLSKRVPPFLEQPIPDGRELGRRASRPQTGARILPEGSHQVRFPATISGDHKNGAARGGGEGADNQ
jgi:hypothetical protein